MQFFEMAPLVAEALKTAEADFVREHPLPAFVFERYDDSQPLDPEQTQELSGRMRASGRFRNLVTFDTQSRVCWISLEVEGEKPGPELSLGRDESCHFVLKHPAVSRKHAVVRRIGAAGGGWLLDDLGSKNGTVLNGHPLTRGKLRDGDVISLGGTVTFRAFFNPATFFRYLQEQANPAAS